MEYLQDEDVSPGSSLPSSSRTNPTQGEDKGSWRGVGGDLGGVGVEVGVE